MSCLHDAFAGVVDLRVVMLAKRRRHITLRTIISRPLAAEDHIIVRGACCLANDPAFRRLYLLLGLLRGLLDHFLPLT
eukprot:5509970-Pyramimonas_sp.AAC.1